MAKENEKKGFPAKVVKNINEYQVAINRGSEEGVKMGQRFLIYRPNGEIIDPDTEENLGILEIPLGTGRVVDIQEKMAVIESDIKRRVTTEADPYFFHASYFLRARKQTEAETQPFNFPEIGDYAKPI